MSDYWNSIKDNLNALPTWGKALIGVTVVGGSILLMCKGKGQKRPYKSDYKPNVVYVYQYPRTAFVPCYSPYCLKLETWLRMSDIAYENVDISIWVRSKEGTLPYVELNGVEYDDSSFIIRDLTKIMKKEFVDGSLSAEQKAVSRAYEQMVDTSTYPSFGYIRLTQQLNEMISEKFGFRLPTFFRLFFPVWMMRRQGLKRLSAHGIGHHPPQEIIGIGLDDLKSISAYLSTKQFLHGDVPTKVDAVLFGYLAQIVYVPLESPHEKLLNTECRNLVRYCDRIRAKYWPDWDEICKTRQ